MLIKIVFYYSCIAIKARSSMILSLKVVKNDTSKVVNERVNEIMFDGVKHPIV